MVLIGNLMNDYKGKDLERRGEMKQTSRPRYREKEVGGTNVTQRKLNEVTKNRRKMKTVDRRS
jgi:hypothetical protein